MGLEELLSNKDSEDELDEDLATVEDRRVCICVFLLFSPSISVSRALYAVSFCQSVILFSSCFSLTSLMQLTMQRVGLSESPDRF